MQIPTFSLRLVSAHMISPKVKHFVFKIELPNTFNYLAGQFITIHFQHQGKSLKRSYSIANEPNPDNVIEFAASYFKGGPGTEYLFALQPGDIVTCSGPFGRLILKPSPPQDITRFVFVATSTGVTPFRAMLPELELRLKQNPTMQVLILLGVQRKDEILYADEFRQFAKNNPQQAQFHPCLSRENPEYLAQDELLGYVQSHFPQFNLQPAQDMVYLCGNPSMIDDAFNYLKTLGFAVQQIIREKYISR